MIFLGFDRLDRRIRHVAVAARPDDAVQYHGCAVGGELVAQVRNEVDRFAVDVGEFALRRTQICGPVRMGLPGWAVQDESGAVPVGQRQEAPEITCQRVAPGRLCEQRMGRELANLDALVEYQVRLQACVGQEQFAAGLRQLPAE